MNFDDLNQRVNDAINNSPYTNIANSLSEEQVKAIREKAKEKRLNERAERERLKKERLDAGLPVEELLPTPHRKTNTEYPTSTWIYAILACIIAYLIITNF